MYTISNQPPYQQLHKEYYQYSGSLFNETNNAGVLAQNKQYDEISSAALNAIGTQTNKLKADEKCEKNAKKTLINRKSSNKKRASDCCKPVDTSSFTVEERLVAAVWVHERRHTLTTMSQIKRDFRQRFRREPPAKNTLLQWERKCFATGGVHDAPRSGRPVTRKCHVQQVEASIRSTPSLSLKQRSAALRVPRTTLRTILHKDLPHTLTDIKERKGRIKPGR